MGGFRRCSPNSVGGLLWCRLGTMVSTQLLNSTQTPPSKHILTVTLGLLTCPSKSPPGWMSNIHRSWSGVCRTSFQWRLNSSSRSFHDSAAAHRRRLSSTHTTLWSANRGFRQHFSPPPPGAAERTVWKRECGERSVLHHMCVCSKYSLLLPFMWRVLRTYVIRNTHGVR